MQGKNKIQVNITQVSANIPDTDNCYEINGEYYLWCQKSFSLKWIKIDLSFENSKFTCIC